MRHCPACGKVILAGKAFCWMPQCRAIFLFNGIGKGIITDEYVKDVMKRSKSKVARVSECTAETVEATVGTVIVGSLAEEEELGKEAEKR